MPEQLELGNPKKLNQPCEHKAKVCIWGDLTVADMDVICSASTAEDRKILLANKFGLYNGDSDGSAQMKDAILLDLYLYTIQFCLENGFNKEQTSTFFSIIKRTHAITIETPFGNLAETFKYFRDMILCHSVKRPPFSIDLFSAEQVRLLTEYTVHTYFRHFKMYKYVYTPQVKLDLSFTYEGIDVPSPPPEAEAEPESEDVQTEEVAPERQPTPEVELTPAQKELRALIEKQFNEEVSKLRSTFEEQLKVTEDGLSRKLNTAEVQGGRGSSKAGNRKKK